MIFQTKVFLGRKSISEVSLRIGVKWVGLYSPLPPFSLTSSILLDLKDGCRVFTQDIVTLTF